MGKSVENSVRNTLREKKTGVMKKGTPKTKSSRRYIKHEHLLDCFILTSNRSSQNDGK